ncbi:MAG: hypothetical protein ACXWPM_12145 [Bdellovibrionota bacterium]
MKLLAVLLLAWTTPQALAGEKACSHGHGTEVRRACQEAAEKYVQTHPQPAASDSYARDLHRMGLALATCSTLPDARSRSQCLQATTLELPLGERFSDRELYRKLKTAFDQCLKADAHYPALGSCQEQRLKQLTEGGFARLAMQKEKPVSRTVIREPASHESR